MFQLPDTHTDEQCLFDFSVYAKVIYSIRSETSKRKVSINMP